MCLTDATCTWSKCINMANKTPLEKKRERIWAQPWSLLRVERWKIVSTNRKTQKCIRKHETISQTAVRQQWVDVRERLFAVCIPCPLIKKHFVATSMTPYGVALVMKVRGCSWGLRFGCLCRKPSYCTQVMVIFLFLFLTQHRDVFVHTENRRSVSI